MIVVEQPVPDPGDDLLPSLPDDEGGLLDDLLDPLPDLGEIVPGPTDLTEPIADALLAGFLDRVMTALADAAVGVNRLVLSGIDSSSSLDPTTAASSPGFRVSASIGAALVLAFLLASIVRGLLRGEFSLLARAVLVDAPVALFGTGLVVAGASIVTGVTDAATAVVLDTAAVELGEGFTEAVTSPAGAAPPGLLLGLLLAVYVAAGLVTWLWLLLRSALLVVLVSVAPLAIATRAFPPAALFARRLVEVGVALVVSKFVLALVLSVGASLFTESIEAGDVSGVAVSVAVMCVAAFVPQVVLKLVPFAEAATASAGVERAPLRAAATGAGIAVGAAGLRHTATTTTAAPSTPNPIPTAAATPAPVATQPITNQNPQPSAVVVPFADADRGGSE